MSVLKVSQKATFNFKRNMAEIIEKATNTAILLNQKKYCFKLQHMKRTVCKLVFTDKALKLSVMMEADFHHALIMKSFALVDSFQCPRGQVSIHLRRHAVSATVNCTTP